MALPEDHLAKFHKMADAKKIWEAIKSKFGGNDESKKMHKYLLKQQFEGFFVFASKGLHKGYDRFQTLLSQLEIHGAGVSHEDANQNGNGHVYVTIDTNEMIKVLPSKTAEEVVARERERKARTTLLMALPEDHLAKFHKMADAKKMWEAIKSRFGGNDESKKMQKYLLKQQFKGFFVFASKGLHKGYDRFQTLLSQLEIHGAGVSHEDANQKFLGSIPSSWSQVPIAPADPLVAPEVGAVSVISPTEVLDLVNYSSSFDSYPSEDSLPLAADLPLVSSFLYFDDSEAKNKSHEAIPFGPPYHTHPNGPRKLLTARKRVGPFLARRLAWRHSLPDSSSGHFSGCGASDQSHLAPSTRVTSPRLVYPLVRTPRCSEAFMRWRSAPLSILYPPTTSMSSLNSSSERSSEIHTHPRIVEEHIEIGTADAEAIADLAGVNAVQGKSTKGLILMVKV
nr:ribonuclease H-like domain-containing protein [Tanacetum cinerariifolium]